MSSQRSWFSRAVDHSYAEAVVLSLILAACSSNGSRVQAVAAGGTGDGAASPSAAAGSAASAAGATGASTAVAGGGGATSAVRTAGSGGSTDSAGVGGSASAGTGGSAGTTDSEQAAGTGGTAGAESGLEAGSGGGAGESSPAAAAGSGGAESPPPVANVWPMMGYDAKNWYYNPAETKLSASNASQLVEKWRFTVEGSPTGSPAIAEGKVFATSGGGLYAIDLITGKKIWSRTDIATTSSAAYEDGAIYVMNLTPPQLYKLKAADGTTIWGPSKAYDPDNSDGESSPIIAGGKLIVGHANTPRETSLDANAAPQARGGVEAFDAASGEKLWTYYTLPEVKAGTENGASVWSSVAIDVEASTVFATTGNNFTVAGPSSDAFHAFDLATAERRWVSQVRKDDIFCLVCGGDLATQDMDFGANPILAEVGGRQIVAAGNKTSTFYAVDRKTGEKVWSRDKLSASYTALYGGIFINGAFDGHHFYVVANDSDTETATVYKLDPTNGADVWTHKLDDVTWGATSLANGLLVVPNNATLYVMSAEKGDVLTKFETGGTIAGGAAAIADEHIVVKSGLTYIGNVTPNNQIIGYGLP